MKTFTLLTLLLIINLITYGQQPLMETQSLISPDGILSTNLKHTENPILNNYLRSAVDFVPIGTSYNLYSILNSEQGQVSYNPDINTIAFVHRQNDGTPGGSGGLAFDYSTDGGATWTINQILTPNYNAGTTGMSGNRVPSGALWNPSGNTNPNAAYFVTHGPCLTPVTGSWGATVNASQKLNGAKIKESYYSENNLSNDYIAYGIQAYASGSLWDCKINLDLDTVYINEATFIGGINSFEFNSTAIAPDWYMTNGELAGINPKYMTVFNEQGIIGYTIIIGTLNSDPIHNLQPTILKTEDAGGTWSYLPWFDLSSLTEIQNWLIPSDAGAGPIKPSFNEFDATVDADGRLNIFAAVSSGLSSNTFDSLFYTYSNHEVMLHFSVSDGSDWTAKKIGFSNLTKINIGFVELTYNPQISRTANGERIFMIWAMSDSLLYDEHSAPDIHAMGYEVETGYYTVELNITEGTDYANSAYYPTMSSVSIDNDYTYELPVVFALPGELDISPPQYYYIKGITFFDEEFCSIELTINITASDTTNFCQGDSVILTATHDGTSVQWRRNGTDIPGATDENYTVTKKGNYRCIVSNACGITKTSTPIIVNVTKPPVAIISADGATTFCPGDSVTLSIIPKPDRSYQWMRGSTTIAGATNSTYVAKYNGVYRCLVTIISTGCSKSSGSIPVTASCKIADTFELEMYVNPNPTIDEIYLQISEELNNDANIRIYNLTGSLLIEKTLPAYSQTININLENFATGMYILELQTADKIITQKIMKE
ncbi:MAG: T9SS type A sorting domain-containing protein [Bacteroidetes bacterium]|nr:T9SS type A sorting domain-containing protein [Bacteroidota bacterium]MBK8488184.1 T9SS type A sorting domain-containing protein [Bacteroidota bacterium]